MKTKVQLLLALFMVISSFSFGQDYKKEIEKDFTNYVNLLVAGEYAKSADYIYEEIFTIVPKEDLIKYMEQAFNSPEVDIELKDPKILGIEASEKIEDKHYAMLTHSLVMMMRQNIAEEETEEEKESRIDMTQTALGASFGEENVSYDAQTGYFRIYSEKLVCAISENGTDKWKFVTMEKEQKQMLDSILPKQIVKKM